MCSAYLHCELPTHVTDIKVLISTFYSLLHPLTHSHLNSFHSPSFFLFMHPHFFPFLPSLASLTLSLPSLPSLTLYLPSLPSLTLYLPSVPSFTLYLSSVPSLTLSLLFFKLTSPLPFPFLPYIAWDNWCTKRSYAKP